jgi:hypothetical protein
MAAVAVAQIAVTLRLHRADPMEVADSVQPAAAVGATRQQFCKLLLAAPLPMVLHIALMVDLEVSAGALPQMPVVVVVQVATELLEQQQMVALAVLVVPLT